MIIHSIIEVLVTVISSGSSSVSIRFGALRFHDAVVLLSVVVEKYQLRLSDSRNLAIAEKPLTQTLIHKALHSAHDKSLKRQHRRNDKGADRKTKNVSHTIKGYETLNYSATHAGSKMYKCWRIGILPLRGNEALRSRAFQIF